MAEGEYFLLVQSAIAERKVDGGSRANEYFSLAMSMGIVQSHYENQETMEALLHRADQAMYEVKKQRKKQGFTS